MEKRRYITGIDGIRTLAVIGVIFYHLLDRKLPGGYLGVPLFFVISGYLMTTILYDRWEKEHKIHLRSFYTRRIKRLLPSLAFFLILCGAFFGLTDHSFLVNFRQIVASSLLCINNWWQLANKISYFDNFSQSAPFVHLWSLSIEAQFYLILPLLFGVFRKLLGKGKKLIWFFVSLSGISLILMALFYNPENLNRVYYGTDTRLFSFLIGSILALFLKEYPKKSAYIFNLGTGIVTLIVTISGFFLIPDDAAWVYYGGMGVYSIVVAFLLGSVVKNDLFNRLLTNSFTKWCGSRSYEIYLFQLPVMLFYEKALSLTGANLWLHIIIQLLIIAGLSELSYQIVGQHFRYLQWNKAYWKTLWKTTRGKVLIIVGALLLGMFSYGMIMAPTATQGKTALQKSLEENKKIIDEKLPALPKKETKETEKVNQPKAFSEVKLTKAELARCKEVEISGIGDSVLLNAGPYLKEIFPKIDIDAEVGRQLFKSEDIFKTFSKDQRFGDYVIIVLGTNGSFTDEDISKLLRYTKKKQVFLVNTVVPKKWQEEVNSELKQTAKKYKNVTLIDWKSYGETHPAWYYEDGVHMLPEGAEAYATYIAKQVVKKIPK